MMRIVLVAGEASGDELGAGLICELKARYPQIECAGIGGPRMAAAGMKLWHPAEKLAVMGLDAIKGLLTILQLRRDLLRKIRQFSPVMYIGIDAPDFNLSIEKKLKRQGMLVVHYVSPSLWAWRGYRIKHIAKAVHKILVLFPFEEALYQKQQIPVAYVGHLIADQIPLSFSKEEWRKKLRLQRAEQVIALLPGSRKSEIKRLAPLMLKVMFRLLEKNPRRVFVWPCISKEVRDHLQSILYHYEIPEDTVYLYHGHARQALMVADAALIASGSATLEAALCRCPMVITYRLSSFGAWLAKRLRYQPWVGLPNILSKKFIVPELLQDEATEENLTQAMENILALDIECRQRLQKQFLHIHQTLLRRANEQGAFEVGKLLTAQA